MASGAGAAAWRRFVVTVSGTNFTVLDSGTNLTVTTALAAAATQTLNLFTLEGGGVILAVKCKPTLAFTGGGVTASRVEVGRASGTDNYLASFNIFSAAADSAARRSCQKGGTIKSIACPTPDVTAATAAAPVAATVTGAVVGDRVLGLTALYSIAAGFTEAGSTGGSLKVGTPGVDFESVVSVADQVQFIAGTLGDLTPYTGCFLLEKGGGLESDAVAGTAINALIRCLGGNVSALTAGSMEIDLLVADAPVIALGNG